MGKLVKASIGFFGATIIFSLLSCSSLTRQYEDEYPVEITYEQFTEYYRQFQSRFLLWQEAWGLPTTEELAITIPGEQELYRRLDFYEFPSTANSTCYFREPSKLLIGDDKWESGCVPHEIGHAVLYITNHPCWGEFEHEEERVKCQKRF